MTFPVYFSLLFARFLVNFVFSGFNFYWAYSQLPSVVESNAISQFNLNQMNSNTISAANAPHANLMNKQQQQQQTFNLYGNLNADARIPPMAPHHSKIQ